MPTSYDNCIKEVNRKIKTVKIKKTFKCTKEGKKSNRGSKRCKTSAYAICSKLRKNAK